MFGQLSRLATRKKPEDIPEIPVDVSQGSYRALGGLLQTSAFRTSTTFSVNIASTEARVRDEQHE